MVKVMYGLMCVVGVAVGGTTVASLRPSPPPLACEAALQAMLSDPACSAEAERTHQSLIQDLGKSSAPHSASGAMPPLSYDKKTH